MAKHERAVLIMWNCGLMLMAWAGPAEGGSWPQWGRTDDRNMVSPETNLPDDFNPGQAERDESDPYRMKLNGARNVKWAARLGSHTYGNPTVADGRVYVGTNDFSLRDDRFKSRKGGLLLCLAADNGRTLWSLAVPPFHTDKPNFNYDDAHYGVCSSPTVEGNRVYVVSNRGEVLCLDTEGMANGNDGPYLDEGVFLADPPSAPAALRPQDGDIIWRYDMITEVPSWPQDASNCSVLIYQDQLYINTSNGVDKGHKSLPFPDSATLIVLDKKTGKLLAHDNEKIGRRTFHGNWSSPSLATVNGRPQILLGGGDGYCYAFEPAVINADAAAPADLKLIWKCNGNPPEYLTANGQPIPYQKLHRSFDSSTWGVGPGEIISTPVCVDNRVYVTVGQDPLHGRGDGALTCIDATGSGDISATGRLWTCGAINRSLSTVSVMDGLLFVADFSGRIHCLDAVTGQEHWTLETESPIWSSTLVADGKIYLGTENRDLWILRAGKELKEIRKIHLRSPMYNTPVAADGVLYIATEKELYAVSQLP